LFCVVAYVPKATVQAAIGAIPLAAGVASGEMILAVAVLSILLTAPLGAIGIIFLGERVLDREDRPVYRFRQIREKLGLPRVGERVRSKQSGTVWKVIEEKEIWLDDPTTPEAHARKATPVPAISLRFWRDETDLEPGTGKTMSYRYGPIDPSFHEHWEILYDS
jgi:hypothetical protein